MSTLDQLVLLEQKVEGAVAKIQQLQAENDALRNKCAELTNALSAKTEQLSSFETDKGRIETGIQKALERLNTIENSILQDSSVSTPQPKIQQPVQAEPQPVQKNPIVFPNTSSKESENSDRFESFNDPAATSLVQDFDSMNNVGEEEEPNSGDFGFDIF